MDLLEFLLFPAFFIIAAAAAILPLVAGFVLLVRRIPVGLASSRTRIILRPCEHVDLGWFETNVASSSEHVVVACGSTDIADARVLVVALSDTAPINRKVAYLERALASLPSEFSDAIIVQADADVVLEKHLIEHLVTMVERDDVIAFSPPLPVGGSNASELLAQAVLATSLQSFAVVWSLTAPFGLPSTLAGKLVALRRTTLERLGGYASIRSMIGDDIALADRAHREGVRIALGPPAMTSDPLRTINGFASQLIRWMQVLRAHRPILFFLHPLLMAPSLVLVTLAVLVWDSHFVPIALIVVALLRALCAVVLTLRTYRHARLRVTASAFALTFFADLVLVDAWAVALFRPQIRWRGRRYQVANGGGIVSVLKSRS